MDQKQRIKNKLNELYEELSKETDSKKIIHLKMTIEEYRKMFNR